jgi:GTPase SAR1 family protein
MRRMGDYSILTVQPQRRNQLAAELKIALSRTPPSELSAWSKRSAQRFVSVSAKRLTGFGSLLAKFTSLSADELVRVISAFNGGTLGEYANDWADKAQRLAAGISERGQSVLTLMAKTIESRPSDAATHLLGAVVGFYCGSGGDGDGGIPDLDLLGGIGAHRSIFTHSIIAGAFIETAVMSLVDLTQVVHAFLPAEHSEFWDTLLHHTEIGSSTFVSGASIGIATHLGVDTLLDGFTPYKDLPIALPQFAHELLMGLNAGIEGTYGARRYAQDLQEFGAPVLEPDVTYEASASSQKSSQKSIIPQLPASEALNVPDEPMTASPANELSSAKDLSDRVRQTLGIDTSAIDEVIQLARKRMEHASGPFCLGVVGEFRVGKSTLINALIGREVAFTDFLEATPVICRFTHGSELDATFVYTDGREEGMSIEECTATLDERRHDRDWAEGVVRVDYRVPSEALHALDLWDAPGLGGSEENDLLAQQYLSMLGGAIWVMDATLVGKATIANPVARMHADGKPIICVLNRIDETVEDPEVLKGWVAAAYPGVFSDIVSFSAESALDAVVDGQVSSDSLSLWGVINRAIGASAEAGDDTRSLLTTANANALVATKLHELRRDIEDRLGALEHFRSGLQDAKQLTLQDLTNHIQHRAETVFAELEVHIEGELAKSNWAPTTIDKVISLLSDSEMLSEISRRVADEALALADQTWLRVSEQALALSEAAVPMDNLVGYYSVDRPSQDRETLVVDHGVYVGGMTAIGAGTIAAISTIVTWPVILMAIPVGALAMWKKRRDISPSRTELRSEINDLIAQMKRAYVEKALPEIETRVGAAIDQQIGKFLLEKKKSLTNGVDTRDVANFGAAVEALANRLNGQGNSHTKAEWSGKEVIELLANPGTRLDIVTQDLNFSLSPVLRDLPACTEVRVIFNAGYQSCEELEKVVAAAFKNWPGRKRTKAISGGEAIELDTVLLMQDRCLISASNLGQLLEAEARFRNFEGGRLAGQHLFAGLWEGAPYKGVPIEAFPVH